MITNLMVEDRDIYIHVGLPKTATTYLQKFIFPQIKGINYFSPIHYAMPNYILSIEPDTKPTLISDEYLSSHYFIDIKGNKSGSRFTIAKRLKKLFPNARIILVLRNKEDWLKSLYVQYIKSPYRPTISFEVFREELEKTGATDFEKYVDFLNENFNEVLVLHYEELKSNPRSFIKKICDFMNVEMPSQIETRKTNVRINQRQILFINWVKKRGWSYQNKKRLVDLFLFLTGGKK